MSGMTPHTYLGLGLQFDFSERKVIVSKLYDGPAARAGVTVGNILLEYNGTNIDFDTGEKLTAFLKGLPTLKIGESRNLRFLDGETERTVCLVAEEIILWIHSSRLTESEVDSVLTCTE